MKLTNATLEVASARPVARTGRLRPLLSHAAPALLGYAAAKLIGGLTVVVWALASGKQVIPLLTKFDGGWYLQIARHGYDMGERLQSNMAFFPLYPGLVAALEPLTPLGHHSTALLISWAASIAAAWGLFAIGDHLFDRRVGVALAVVWGVLPHGIVQSMAYTEGLFTALVAWSLLALLRRQWLTAAILCLFAGLTRPTATALIAVVGLAALIAVARRQDGWRPLAAMLVAPLGWLGYLAWVGWVTGRPDGWFHIQGAGWGMGVDFGISTARQAAELLGKASALDYYVVTLVLLLAIMLLALGLLDRQPWQLLLFAALLLANTLAASDYYHAKARFLLPAFPLLLPVAVALARTTRARAGTILVTLTIASAYFGGYLLLVWGYSP